MFEALTEQITLSIRHECLRYSQPCTHCEERGKEAAIAFMHQLPRLRGMLATDVRAAYQGDPAAKSFDEIIFSYPGLFAITVYRLAHQLQEQGIPLIARIMTEFAHSMTGIDIHPGANIGESFFIDHGTGVVIGETCEIGKRVRIYRGRADCQLFSENKVDKLVVNHCLRVRENQNPEHQVLFYRTII